MPATPQSGSGAQGQPMAPPGNPSVGSVGAADAGGGSPGGIPSEVSGDRDKKDVESVVDEIAKMAAEKPLSSLDVGKLLDAQLSPEERRRLEHREKIPMSPALFNACVARDVPHSERREEGPRLALQKEWDRLKAKETWR